MEITRRPDLELFRRKETLGRSPGVHLSSIIRYIEKTAFRQDWKDFNRMTPSEQQEALARWESGWMWEEVLTAAFTGRGREGSSVVSLGELERDGVIMTLDGFHLADDCVEEYKYTWKSMRGAEEDAEKALRTYLMQLMSYCGVTETDKGRLRVFFVNGDYRGTGPCQRVWDFRFTEQELQENWACVLNHKEFVEAEKEAG